MKRLGTLMQEYGVLVALFVLVAFNCLGLDRRTGTLNGPGEFLQMENLRNLLSQHAFIGIIAIGMTFVIILGGIDLSVGSLVALCGAVGILVLNKWAGSGSALILAGLAAVAVGSVAGFLNGLTIALGRVAPFIVTLAGLAAFRSIALVLGEGGEIRSQVPAYQEIGFGGVALPFAKTARGDPVMLYWSAIVFIVVALLAGFLLNKTKFGRHVVAVGANEKAACYSAIDTRRVKIVCYTMLGALVGLSAFLNGARMNSVGTGSVGLFYELDAIAAVVIGGTSLAGGKGRIWGTFVGVLLLNLINYTITHQQVDPNWQGAIRGGVILAAVLLQRGTKASTDTA